MSITGTHLSESPAPGEDASVSSESASVAGRVRELVGPVVRDAGADLYDVRFGGGVLRILVDRPGGIDVGAIASISRRAGRALDEADAVPGRYTLEVSSPGLERPLRRLEHFAGAIGEQVTIKTRCETLGARRFDGELVAADSRGVEIAAPDGPLRLDYDQIAKARTVFAFRPAGRSQEHRS